MKFDHNADVRIVAVLTHVPRVWPSTPNLRATDHTKRVQTSCRPNKWRPSDGCGDDKLSGPDTSEKLSERLPTNDDAKLLQPSECREHFAKRAQCTLVS